MQKMGFFLLLCLCLQTAWAQERVALVIGNSHYQNEAPLKNPVNDAEDIAAALERLDFQVTLKTNLNRKDMALVIRDFGKQLKPDTVGLFYFSGHGMQVAGRNYLIPVSASIAAEDEVPFESIDAGRVLAKMEKARNGLNIIILDACRNNRFQLGFKGGKQGLARITAPVGSVLVYATAPGDVAADGIGRNGLFTKHLLQYIETPGLTISDVLLKTRVAVVNESRFNHPKRQQVPWESSSLLTPFCFAGCDKPSQPLSLGKLSATRTVAHVSKPQMKPKIKVLEPEMITIPAGRFRMGCVNNETTPHCEDRNKPIQMNIKAFDLGKTEVTFEQWDNCVQTGGCSHKPSDEGWGRDQRPVIHVSWEDAQAYVKWLSQSTGKKYRLPSEAEWEYAARIGTKSSSDRSLAALYEERYEKTQEVLLAKKNTLGLYGMYGNVWEWTQNCYHEAYDQPLEEGWDRSCYQYESGSLTAVLRGGSWVTPPTEFGVTARSINYRNRRDLDYGFRVARSR